VNIPGLSKIAPILLLALWPAFASAGIPLLFTASIRCLRSATLLVCTDKQGSYYGISQRGSDILIRGYDAPSKKFWAQTSTRYGRLNIFTGLSSDGQVWFGSSKRLGWNIISRFSTSSGDRGKVSCNRLKGCD
jgi:hypothetical protein